MKRTVAAITMVLTLAGGLAHAGAQPGAAFVAGQEASAWWVVMKGDRGKLWIAEARRMATDAGPVVEAFVGRGKCTSAVAGGWHITTCRGKGRVKAVGVDEFQMDPALQSASLDVRIGKYRHRVEWASEGTPGLGQSAYGYGGAASAGATAAVAAPAHGTVFNSTDVRKGCELCYLAEGGGAAAWAAYSDRDISIERHGDRFEARLTLKRRI